MADIDVRPEVAAFALLMEAKLRENDHKGGWRRCTTTYLSRRLGNELEELRAVVSAFNKADSACDGEAVEVLALAVGREAADVANFAMMLADLCDALRTTRAHREPRGRNGGAKMTFDEWASSGSDPEWGLCTREQAREAYAAGLAAGLEKAEELVRAEQLTELVDNEGDRGYRNAVEDCERAIAAERERTRD